MVVDITLAGRHPTAGEQTGRDGGGGLASLRDVGSAASGSAPDRPASPVGDRYLPLLFRFGSLAGDIGDHRAPTGDFAGVFIEPGQRREIDSDVDDTAPPLRRGSIGVVADEKINEDGLRKIFEIS